MTKSKFGPDAVEWRPHWEGEDLEKYNQARAALAQEISSFRDLRNALGFSQAEAAVRLSTTQSNISKIEAKSDPSLSILSKLLQGHAAAKVVVTMKDGRELILPLKAVGS